MLSEIVELAEIAAAFNVPVNVGEADRTTLPDPVLVVAPVPPLVTASTPDELTPSAKIDRLRDMVICSSSMASYYTAGLFSIPVQNNRNMPLVEGV